MNQNRKKIIYIIFVIIFIFMIIQTLNSIMKKEEEEKINNYQENKTEITKGNNVTLDELQEDKIEDLNNTINSTMKKFVTIQPLEQKCTMYFLNRQSDRFKTGKTVLD